MGTRVRRDSRGTRTHRLGVVLLEDRRLLSHLGPDPGNPVPDPSQAVDAPVLAEQVSGAPAVQIAVTAAAAVETTLDPGLTPGSGAGSRIAGAGVNDQG